MEQRLAEMTSRAEDLTVTRTRLSETQSELVALHEEYSATEASLRVSNEEKEQALAHIVSLDA